MNNLLIFFAIPLATIILSAIFETFINCPFKVAGIFFSIFIVVAFALGGSAEFIVGSSVYTIISFVSALIVKLFTNKRMTTNLCPSTIANTTAYTDTNLICYAEPNSTLNTNLSSNINSNSNPNVNSTTNATSFSEPNYICRRFR